MLIEFILLKIALLFPGLYFTEELCIFRYVCVIRSRTMFRYDTRKRKWNIKECQRDVSLPSLQMV